MKRLFWKEWQEKKLWLVVFFAFVALTPFLSRDGFSFCGRIETTSMWVFVMLAPALLLGLSTFSSESRNECQNFIYSRAIGWKRILAAKVLIDICIMLMATIAGAIFFWLHTPLEYLQFIGFGRFLAGIGIAFGVSLIGYLPGFGASFVLPGMLGGGLVIFLIGVVIDAEASILTKLTNSTSIPYALGISWVIALVTASIIVTKCDVGISVKERVKKYSIYIAVISSVMLVFAVPISIHFGPYPETPKFGFASETLVSESSEEITRIGIDVSPGGKYLLEGALRSDGNIASRMKLVRLSDGKTVFLNINSRRLRSNKRSYGWCTPDTLIFFPYVRGNGDDPLIKLNMDDSGKIVRQEIKPTFSGYFNTLLSSSGSMAVVTGILWERSRNNTNANPVEPHCVCIIDVRRMKQIYYRTFADEVDDVICRWDSDNDLQILSVSKKGDQRQYQRMAIHISSDGEISVENDGKRVLR